MKIAYCLNSVRYLGGIQKVTIVKANALADIPGNDIYIIVTDNKTGVLTEPLSQNVHLIDLDINYYADDYKSRWHVLKGIFIKRRQHKEKLRIVLNDIQPDIVISVGQSEKYMIPSIKGRWKTIREFHFVKDYRIKHAQSVFAKALAWLGDFYDFSFKIKGYDQIVILTQEDKVTNWQGWNNITVIPNPCTFVTEIVSDQNRKKVVSVGRLTPPKNYASLIRAFKKVVDRHPDWVLEIYGDGSMKAELLDLIDRLNLKQNVYLKGYSSDVSQMMSNSSVFALSSVFEGFPLVIVEAMSCGLPVVSYACPCGPKDIITEGKDGFLVNPNDEVYLADRISYLIENDQLRKTMSVAALAKAKHYRIDRITSVWMDLFKMLTDDSTRV